MRVAIIGGTGFVGGYLTEALLGVGHSVSQLVRRGSESKVRRPEQVLAVNGDIADIDSIRRLLHGCDAVIYNVGNTYALGGPEVLTWKEMVSRIAAATGRHKWFLPMPIALMRIGATLLDWLPLFPVTRDQLTMLEEGNVADPEIMKALTGREPKSFSVENLDYLGNE